MSASDDPESEASPPQPHPLRRFPRIALALTVRLSFRSMDAAIDSRTVDISEGGVFIHMKEPRREGTAIRLELLVGARQLEIGGVVVRSIRPEEPGPTGIGVLFTEIRDEDLATVQSLVSSRLSQPED